MQFHIISTNHSSLELIIRVWLHEPHNIIGS